jgi:hypothetical protein
MNRKFVFHGVYLIVVGIIAVLYNPHTGHFGFNPDAKSGLIVTGIFALLSLLWAFVYSRNRHRIATIGGIVTTILLFAGTIPRASGAWTGYARGDTTKWFAAVTISLVIIGTVPLFASLVRNLRTKP